MMAVADEAEAEFYRQTLHGSDYWCRLHMSLQASDGCCFSVEVSNHEGATGWAVIVREVPAAEVHT